jgi:hypothetical protein
MLAVHQPLSCRIQFRGEIDRQSLSGIFAMDCIESRDGIDRRLTTLQGYLPDYAALYGILNYLYDLGLPLVSVEVS